MIRPDPFSHIKKKIESISNKIICLHSDAEAIIIAKAILEEKAQGPVVECGCFQGGMTSKLSIACKIAGKKLYVYDTFKGLPHNETATCFKSQKHKDGVAGIKKWKQGEMSCGLEEVMKNVKEHGEISVCQFFPGTVQETLPEIKFNPSLVFMDIDLREAARTCLKYLWPKLEGKYFFTHEMWFEDYVNAITDREWWLENIKEEPPKLTGAETGLNNEANDLGYFIKPYAAEAAVVEVEPVEAVAVEVEPVEAFAEPAVEAAAVEA